MRSRDILGRLRLRVKLFGGSGGSGSGSGSDDQALIWALTSNMISKNTKCQNMTSYWLGCEFECYILWTSGFEICHTLSSKATGWQWRGHRLLLVALSEISGLGTKWSFATDN